MSQLEDQQKRKDLFCKERVIEVLKAKRVNIMVHMVFTFILQLVLIVLTFFEIRYNCEYNIILLTPVTVYIMFARFACATILHLDCVDEVLAGMSMMKFSSNHHYRFNNYPLAWLSGFL
jgi:uncharacterized Tic20 family protein